MKQFYFQFFIILSYSEYSSVNLCPYQCATCNLQGDCITCNSKDFRTYQGNDCVCNDGYFENKKVCAICSYTCATCLSYEKCETCPNTRTLSSGTCQCKIGYFDNKTQICQKCSSNCIACEIEPTNCIFCKYTCLTCSSSKSCLSCPLNTFRFQSGDQCLCQDSYYDAGVQICEKCNPTCKTCQSYTQCTSCFDFQFRQISQNQCICLDRYYDVGVLNCQNCHISCFNCQFQSNNCIECSISDLRTLFGNQCLCNSNYFDSGHQICSQCQYFCKECHVSSDNCLSCPENSFRQNTNNCNCQNGYFDEGLALCSKCDMNCQTCLNSSTHCLSCIQNSLKILSNNSCKCPNGYFDDGIQVCQLCQYSCQTCQYNETYCLTCNVSSYRQLLQNQCFCKDGYYDSGIQVCQKCSQICLTCINHYNCTSCLISDSRILINNSCMCQTGYQDINQKQCQKIVCQDGQYQDNHTLNCFPCSSNCKTCQTINSKCLSCDPLQFRILNNITSHCDCYPNYIDIEGICNIIQFSPQFIPQQCDDISNCILCSGSDCQLCNLGYYQINGFCNKCQDLCLTCNSQGCISCRYVKNKQSGQCIKCEQNNQTLLNDQCQVICGDGLLYQEREECDDGNENGLNKCSSQCKIIKQLNKFSISADSNEDIYDGERTVSLVFNFKYQFDQQVEFGLWQFKIQNKIIQNIHVSKSSDKFLVSITLNETVINPILSIYAPNNSNFYMFDTQSQFVPIKTFIYVSDLQKSETKNITNILNIFLIFTIVLFSVSLIVGGFSLIEQQQQIIQMFGYIMLCDVILPYNLSKFSDVLQQFGFQYLGRYLTFNFNIGFPSLNMDLIYPLYCMRIRGYTALFLFNIFGTILAIFFILVLNFIVVIVKIIFSRDKNDDSNLLQEFWVLYSKFIRKQKDDFLLGLCYDINLAIFLQTKFISFSQKGFFIRICIILASLTLLVELSYILYRISKIRQIPFKKKQKDLEFIYNFSQQILFMFFLIQFSNNVMISLILISILCFYQIINTIIVQVKIVTKSQEQLMMFSKKIFSQISSQIVYFILLYFSFNEFNHFRVLSLITHYNVGLFICGLQIANLIFFMIIDMHLNLTKLRIKIQKFFENRKVQQKNNNLCQFNLNLE